MPELIVRKWDGPYSFMVFREYGVYKARRGDTGEVQFEDPSKSVVIQNAVNSLLQGGTVFLREVQLPDDVTFGNNILIVEDYQGERKFYSNNKAYRSTEETASYIVFTEDGVKKAKNGHTGKVEFSDEDAATVIQAALDAIDKGITFIRGSPDIYWLSKSIYVKGHKGLVGEGKYPVRLAAVDGLNTDYLIKTADPTPAESEFPIILKNLWISGNKAGGASCGGIYLCAFESELENLRVDNFTGDGVKVSADSRGRGSGNYLRRIYVYNCDGNGIYVVTPDTQLEHLNTGLCGEAGVFVDQFTNQVINILQSYGNMYGLRIGLGRSIRVTNVNLAGNDVGLYAYQTWKTGALISDMTIWDNTEYHIQIEGTSGLNSKGIHFNNVLFDSVDKKPDYAIYMKYAYARFEFKNLELYTTPYNIAMWQITNPVSLQIEWSGHPNTKPPGYLTKNWGVATILNGQTSVTFAHGLYSTPTVVTLGATHAEVADAVWSANTSNITITVPSAVTADRDISWYAVV